MRRTEKLDIKNGFLADASRLRLGRVVKFTPSFLAKELSVDSKGHPIYLAITGTVCKIYPKHRYFTVSFKRNGHRFLESFKY